MFNTTIKNLLGHKARVIITAVAIIAGVSFMAGTFILTDTINKAFDSLFAQANQGVDAVVRQKADFKLASQGPGSNSGEQRDRIPIALTDTIDKVPGVESSEASIFLFGAYAIGKDNKPINPTNGGAPQFGSNWQVIESMRPYELAEGKPPVGPDQVVIDRATAKRGKLKVGDALRVQALGPTLDVKVVGIVTFDGLDSQAGSSLILMDLANAQKFFGDPGKANTITVHAKPGVSQSELVANLQKVLPKGDEAISGADYTKEQQDSVQKSFSAFSIVLTGFALISLIAGAFLIYNIFGIVVAQRTKELALLRALGAARGQVTLSVLIEAFVTGVIASALGLLAGIGLAVGLTALLAAIGLDLSSTSVVIAPRTIFISMFVGVLVTLVSAILPAIRASRVSPMAAIRDVAIERTDTSVVRVVIGAIVGALGALMVFGGTGAKDAKPVLAGAFFLFIAVVVFGPVLAPIIVRITGAWLPAAKGLTGRLARDNAMRSPRRTASTATALVLALTLVSILTIMFSSFTASINAAVVNGFKGDFQVSGGFTGISPTLNPKLKALPELSDVAGFSVGTASLFKEGQIVWGTDGPDLANVLDIGVDKGSLTALTGNDTIALESGTAETFKKAIGDTFTMGFPNGEAHTFRVVATYTEDGLIGQGIPAKYLLSRPAFTQFEPAEARADLRIMVKTAPGVSQAAARAAVTRVLKEYPTAKVESIKEIQKSQTKQINQALSFFLVLLALTVFIGFLGIAITLALSVIERTRELGLLRAVGMDKRRMKSMVRWEAVLIALLGTALGLALGVLIGACVAICLTKDIDTATLSFPIVRLAEYCIGAALFGVLAAIYPARRAAKLNVLDAISME